MTPLTTFTEEEKSSRIPADGNTSLGSPLATVLPITISKETGAKVTKDKPYQAATKPGTKRRTHKSLSTSGKSTTRKADTTSMAASTKSKSARKPVAKKPTAKKPAIKKATVKKAVTKKPVAKKPAVKKATVKKTVAKKPIAKKTTIKKVVVKKAIAKKPVVKKATVKKTVAKKPVARKPIARKTTTKTTSLSAASRNLGEQIYKSVNDIVATGKTAKAAFDVVARERKMSVANVQQHYYRFKRKGASSARKSVKTAGSRARASKAIATNARTMVASSSVLSKKQVDAWTKELHKVADSVSKLASTLLADVKSDKRLKDFESKLNKLVK